MLNHPQRRWPACREIAVLTWCPRRLRRVLLLMLLLAPTAGLAAPPVLADLGPAPAFILETHDGGRTSLAEHLAAGPVIVDFWATWCAPCRKALPHLQSLQDEYADRGLTVLAVSIDDPRNQPKIDAFARSQKLDFPILLDGDSRVARLYRVASVPTTFLVSPSGRVVAFHRGYRDGDEKLLAAEVAALFASLEEEAAR